MSAIYGAGFPGVTSIISNGNPLVAAQLAPVASTNLLAAAAAGFYRASLYLRVTIAGVGGTTITLNLTYTDGGAAQTIAYPTVTGLTANQFISASSFIQVASGNIAITVTSQGAFTTQPTVIIYSSLERVL